MSPNLAVWIVNFESSTYVDRCLASLVTSPISEVVVLDNGSSREDYERLVLVVERYPFARIYRSECNLGFGGGHNRIASLTTNDPSDLIWLLNPDTEVSAEAVAKLREAIISGACDIVSPLILNERDGQTRIWFSGGEIRRRSGSVEDSQLGRDPSRIPDAGGLLKTDFVTGAAPMMRRGTWDAIGGFDERLFLYWEDVDLSIRAAEQGFSMGVLGGARIVHAEGQSSRGNRGRRALAYYYMSRNRILVCRNPGERGLALVLGAGAMAFARFCAYALLREGAGRVSRIVAIGRGTTDALRTGGGQWAGAS